MSSPLKTALCDLLGIRYPVLSAGMGGPAGPTLAAAVSNAGGLGVIGATGMSPERLLAAIRKIRDLTDQPFGVDLLLPGDIARRTPGAHPEKHERPTIDERHRKFVGALAEEWDLPDEPERPRRTGFGVGALDQQMEILFEERVPVFAAGLGDPGTLVDAAHERGIKVLALVGNVKNARRVAASSVDAVVAQGAEAGGHTGRIGTMALIPQTVDAVAPTPVIAAGGIADGRGLAAALMLGAVGAWCGTAFLATEESFMDSIDDHAESAWRAQVIKQRIVDATDEDTRVSRVLTGKTARLINTPLVEAWERDDAPPTLPMPLQGALVAPLLRRINRGRRADLTTEAMGQVAGMIGAIRPAREVLEKMVERAEQLLDRATSVR